MARLIKPYGRTSDLGVQGLTSDVKNWLLGSLGHIGHWMRNLVKLETSVILPNGESMASCVRDLSQNLKVTYC